MGLDTLDETKPADTDPVSLGDDAIRETRASTKQSFAVEHNLAGQHRFMMGDASMRPPAGNPGRLYLNTSNNTVEYDNGTNWQATGGVLVPGSVGVNELAMNSVNSAKIIDASITGSDIAPNTINTNNIADGAVSSSKIAPGAVGASQLAANSINTANIIPGAITNDRLASGSVSLSRIAVGNSLQFIGGVGMSGPLQPSFGVETLCCQQPWTSRGGYWVAYATLCGVTGVSSSTYQGVAANMRLDGTLGVPTDGTIKSAMQVDSMATATGVVLVPWALTVSAAALGPAGNRVIKITVKSFNSAVAVLRVTGGFVVVIEFA